MKVSEFKQSIITEYKKIGYLSHIRYSTPTMPNNIFVTQALKVLSEQLSQQHEKAPPMPTLNSNLTTTRTSTATRTVFELNDFKSKQPCSNNGQLYTPSTHTIRIMVSR